MFTDLKLLIWLHWRQLLRTTNYWLRVVGFDPFDETTSNRLYGVYLVLIFGGWLILMWSLSVYGALRIGQEIPSEHRDQIRTAFASGFPVVVTFVVIVLLMLALRKTPLKLSVEDLAYIAASPMRREALGLLGFAGYVLTGLAVAVPLTTLLTMMLAHPTSQDQIGLMAYPAILTSVPLVVALAGCAWCAGFWRLRQASPPRLLWLSPLLLAILLFAVPGVLGWPAQVLAKAIVGETQLTQSLALLGAALVLTVVVVWLGRRINLITVASELGTTSQLKSLGVQGRFTWRDLSRQMRDRESLAHHRPLFGLPEASGAWMLAGRAALIFGRQPFQFAWGVIRATAVIAAGVWLALSVAPALAWLFWLTYVMIMPSRDILGVFSADQSNAFLRQFIPADNLKLLTLDTLLPVAVISLLGVSGWLSLSLFFGVSLLGVPLMLSFTALMVLSQGAALVRAPGGDPTVASLIFTGCGFGVVLLLAEFAGPAVAWLVSLGAILLLGWVISGSSRFAAAVAGAD